MFAIIIGCLKEAGTAYPSRAPEITSGFFGGVRVAHLFSFSMLSQSRETDNKLYTRGRQTKQKHTTICVGHHYAQANTNNVNNTCKQLENRMEYHPSDMIDLILNKYFEASILIYVVIRMLYIIRCLTHTKRN
jgi:hypothetical protein